MYKAQRETCISILLLLLNRFHFTCFSWRQMQVVDWIGSICTYIRVVFDTGPFRPIQICL